MRTKVLYASYVKGNSIPYYVRYALQALSASGFSVVYITNKRTLYIEALDFLEKCEIELFFTENHGFDFGMWRRYWQSAPPQKKDSWDRLCLMNDSIVYYKNQFSDFIKRAEESTASMVSLTSSDEFSFHLQSFFLYLKSPAITQFEKHLEETKDSDSFYDVVRNMEIGLSTRMLKSGLTLEALFNTHKDILFSYTELIAEGAGFIKRKLLERRFTAKEKMHFLRHGGRESLYADYPKRIRNNGNPDNRFSLAWLPSRPKRATSFFEEFLLLVFFYTLVYPFERVIRMLKKKTTASS